MKKILKDTLALFLITLISGVLLGFVYKITKEPIKEQELKTKLAAYLIQPRKLTKILLTKPRRLFMMQIFQEL